jgi:hypothetical protein
LHLRLGRRAYLLQPAERAEMNAGLGCGARAVQDRVGHRRGPNIQTMAAGVEGFGQQAIQFGRRQDGQAAKARPHRRQLGVGRPRRRDEHHQVVAPAEGRIGHRRPLQQIPHADGRLRGRRCQRDTDQLGFPELRGHQPSGGDLGDRREPRVVQDQRLPQDHVEQRRRGRAWVGLGLNVGDGGLRQPLDVVALDATTEVSVGGERIGFRKRTGLNGGGGHREGAPRQSQVDQPRIPRGLAERVKQQAAG